MEKQQISDERAVEELLDVAFGRDRFSKAAYAYRDGVAPLAGLSFVLRAGDSLSATLRFWPVMIGGYDAILLGPIAVQPHLQGRGHGIALMKHGLERATQLGHSRVILVGDEDYYSRLGFSRKCAENITMPGQVDQMRLLALELVNGSFDGVSGACKKSLTL